MDCHITFIEGKKWLLCCSVRVSSLYLWRCACLVFQKHKHFYSRRACGKLKNSFRCYHNFMNENEKILPLVSKIRQIYSKIVGNKSSIFDFFLRFTKYIFLAFLLGFMQHPSWFSIECKRDFNFLFDRSLRDRELQNFVNWPIDYRILLITVL